jgi:energy-coupling factor transport system ATP-binding protein
MPTVSLLVRGSIALDGPPRESLRHTEIETLPALLALGRRLDWAPLPLSIKEGRAAQRRNAAIGRMPAPAPSDPALPGGASVVTLQRVSAGWDRYPVLRDIDLDVRPGELIALMGRNGSGKTTLLRLVAGLHRPSSGRVLIAGQDTTRAPRRYRPDGRLSPQNPRHSFFAETLRPSSPSPQHHPQSARPEATLTSLGLSTLPTIIRAIRESESAAPAVLVGGPRVLLLDEPTRGMDAVRSAPGHDVHRCVMTVWLSC